MNLLSKVLGFLKSAVCKVLGVFGLCKTKKDVKSKEKKKKVEKKDVKSKEKKKKVEKKKKK